MIVIVDSITQKEAIEVGHVKIKILLECLFELSNKSKTFCKRCNDEDIITDGGPSTSSMTCKHSSERGKCGKCKTYCFKGIALFTAFAARNLVSLTLVVTEDSEVQSGSGTLHGFKVTPIVV